MPSPADLPLDGTSTVRSPTFELSRRTFLGTAAGSGLAAYAATRTAAAHHDVTSKEGVTMPSTQTDATPTNDAVMQRADELLRQMTIEEKAMQVSCVVPLALLGPDRLMRGQLDALLGLGIGHIAGLGMIGNKMPETVAKTVNAIQRYLVTETRLGISAIIHDEALNGAVAPGFTAFP